MISEQRQLPVSEETRDRILGCTDKTVLETWITRAVTAHSTDELFD